MKQSMAHFSALPLLLACLAVLSLALTMSGAAEAGPLTYGEILTEVTAQPDGFFKVQLGDSNFEFVEVVSGLQPGDEVVVSDMSNYKNKNKLKLK